MKTPDIILVILGEIMLGTASLESFSIQQRDTQLCVTVSENVEQKQTLSGRTVQIT